ncbi:extracellular solute-binding protein [Maritalea porphyrae]|uniref:extracellular solute-binding protein n=1 Tax=Maritalea porphyrae TaxID=880732 RepID=UPI0022AE6AD2|nr:extracellular solute-binding protein [Maritalea porphyrae]MCZ4274145.1 extracellular solute-binding protein [Maritalea porphyrae]
MTNLKRLATSAILGAATFAYAGTALAQTELSFWSWRQEDVKAYNQIIAAFEEQNPDISVTFTAHEAKSYNTILTTALAGGAGPDIMHTRSYGSLEAIAAPGYLEPLDGQIDLSALSADELLGTTLRADGHVYAVPFASQTALVFYNKDLFEKHNVDVPATWEEFKAAADAFKQNNVNPLANGIADGWTAEVMAGALMPNFYGKEFFGEVTSGSADFEDPRFVGALEKIAELKDYMPTGYEGVDYATMKQLFIAGQAAMFVGGSFEIPGFVESGVNFDIMPAPAAKAGDERMVATWLDGGYGVNASSENKEAALKFIQFTATQPFAQMLSDKLANVPAVDGAVIADPMLAKVSAFHAEASPYIMLVGFRFNTPTGSTLLQNGLQELLTGKKTAAEVAKDVSDGIKSAK